MFAAGAAAGKLDVAVASALVDGSAACVGVEEVEAVEALAACVGTTSLAAEAVSEAAGGSACVVGSA
jgi:hypothetical protein